MTKLEAFINKRQKDSPFIKMADFAANKAGHHATVLTKTCTRNAPASMMKSSTNLEDSWKKLKTRMDMSQL